MDVNLVKRLVKILEDSRLTSLEIEEDGFKIKLSKKSEAIPYTESIQLMNEPKHSQTQQDFSRIIGDKKEEHPDKEIKVEPLENTFEIKSPIVGTFYSSPSPDSEPYVKVGDTVKTGQVVCIVEAMKLMNEIEADSSGKIVKIFVSNGQPVEYNQPLFLLAKI